MGNARYVGGSVAMTAPTSSTEAEKEQVLSLGTALPDTDNYIFIFKGGAKPSNFPESTRFVLEGEVHCEGGVITKNTAKLQSGSVSTPEYTTWTPDGGADGVTLSLADGEYSCGKWKNSSGATYKTLFNGTYLWSFIAW